MSFPSPTRPPARLDGTRVLVVDDELLIGLDIEAILTDAGAQVVAVCMTLAEALSGAALPDVSLATLDIRLGRDTSDKVAALLTRRGIPFIFYSGQRLPDEMREQWPDATLITKPAEPSQLVDTLAALLR